MYCGTFTDSKMDHVHDTSDKVLPEKYSRLLRAKEWNQLNLHVEPQSPREASLVTLRYH